MVISYKSMFRIICFACAAMLFLLAGVVYNLAKAQSYKRQLENNLRYSLQEAASGMNSLRVDLKKSSYAGTPAQLSGISAQVLKESGRVKSALENIPADSGQLDPVYKFLSQVGDYSIYLSRRAANGSSPSDEDMHNVQRLIEYSGLLTDNIRDIERMVSSGDIKLADFIGMPEVIPFARDISLTGFDSVEESFAGYPTLIYDGPFSDHLMTRSPVITQTAPQISRDKAREIAAKYANVRADTLLNGGDEISNMPSYTFYNDRAAVGVTINGGFVTYLSSEKQIGEKVLSVLQGRQLAREYLVRMEIDSMRETYYELASGVLTVNFAYTQDDVICYTDLIKVGVSMDDGEIIFYDARDFINNHRERSFEKVAIPPESAQKSVGQSLAVNSYRLALIPTSGENEALTWEFLCTGADDENVLVYINAKTGAEERILIMVENENGVLTV